MHVTGSRLMTSSHYVSEMLGVGFATRLVPGHEPSKQALR